MNTKTQIRKHRNIKFVTTERTKFFTENLLAIEMMETQLLMNKFAYLGLS